jgi:hypothetical protein
VAFVIQNEPFPAENTASALSGKESDDSYVTNAAAYGAYEAKDAPYHASDTTNEALYAPYEA